jgi:SprT protein
MDDRHIRQWIKFACDCNGVSELAQVIVVEWNRRFTRRLGDAAYSPTTYRARIRLSLWPRASEEDRRETIIHETCHLVAFYQHGFVAAHGHEWRLAMRNCGVEPLRLHTVDRTGLARRQRRFVLLDCPQDGSDMKCRCTVREFNLLRRGKEFWYKVCGLHVNRDSAIEEEQAVQKSTVFLAAREVIADDNPPKRHKKDAIPPNGRWQG